MARTRTTGFALIQGAATDAVTDPETRRAHQREADERKRERRERARRAAEKAGLVRTFPVPEGRSPDARRRVGQVQPAGWRM